MRYFALQMARGEAAHGQSVDQIEGELAGGVMPARQVEDLVRQAVLPEVIEDLPGVHREEGAVMAGPNELRFEIASLQAGQVAGRADQAPIAAQLVLGDVVLEAV